ncbi:MAG: Holliday junction branch migration protein RuvA [Patescibacteria group bacterium]|jgi:Holliday junction DNA helicase RuvA|nr:Holliday junction branch migration protein RuvA [Patescibacteria group bacterium]
MIGKLCGKVDQVRGNTAIINVNGVGYQVYMTEVTLGQIVSMDEAEVFIHTHVREDSLTLYGFISQEELEMFELLIGVSGIGPKAGLGLLTIAPPKTIKTAIVNEDSSILTRVSGVGKKTAERVILELQNKIDGLPDESDQENAQTDQEVIEALVSMGYSISEAREAGRLASKESDDLSERITIALRMMKK